MSANRIREFRQLAHLSQTQLAKKLHVTQGAVSQWESGRTMPDTSQLLVLSECLSASVDELLGQETQNKSESTTDDAWELRERLRRDPDMRILFSAASKASPEHLRAAAAMLKALEPEEQDVD